MPMDRLKLQGVIPILVTPFTEQGELDLESLARLVEFNIASGVHGLGVALGSEVYKLAEEEREAVCRTVVTKAEGRVPVVMHAGASGSNLAAHYARRAAMLGANAVMVPPPAQYATGSWEEHLDYYRCVADACDLPIVVQDHAGAPVGADLLARLVETDPRINHCKIETPPTPKRLGQVTEAVGDQMVPLGGAGGNFLIEELRRGSQGTMPSCSIPAAYVAVWDLFQRGELEHANSVFYQRILPFNRSMVGSFALFHYANKELLRRRGVIACSTVRGPIPKFDSGTIEELNRALNRQLALEPQISW